MTRRKQAAFFLRHRLLRVTRHASRLAIIGLLSACSSPDSKTHAEFIAMGTTVTIDVAGADTERANEAIAIARSEVQYLGREWYPWENNGELVRLNFALSERRKTQVSPALAKLLLRAQSLHRASDGYFDPAVGRLVQLWGFHRGERDPFQPWPSDEQLEKWRSNHPTFADLDIDDLTVSSKRDDLVIDLGAIGKGYAVDTAVEILRAHGFTNMLVNAGGNLRALGLAQEGSERRPWRVAIRNPRDRDALAWIELQGDESVSTSGDYERFALRGNERFNHIVEPKTGRSAVHTIAVTVVAEDATLADAASTAIFVAGPSGWRSVARSMGIKQVLRIGADGTIEVSHSLAARLHTPTHSLGSDVRQLEWKSVDL